MNNPLNELSAVYQQNIAEGCGCDEKKKGTKKVEMVPQGDTPMGGDGARIGKNKKSYVEPMGEAYKQFPKDKVEKKIAKKEAEGRSVDAHTMKAVKNFSTKASDFSKDRASEAKAKSKQFKDFEKKDRGDQDYYRRNKNPKAAVKSMLSAVSNEKKSKALKAVSNAGKRMEGYVHENWRHDLAEYILDPAEKNDVVKTSPKNSDDAHEEIKEKKIKNKIKINPPQGVTEGFEELGAVVVEMYELTEKIDLKKADMGEVIKDFRKSDAPQFKGKSDKKIQKMAIAAKLDADEEAGGVSEETEEEKKKRILMAKTKEHDDKQSGKLAEQSGGGLAKLGPREEGKRKDKGKKKPQAIRQSRAQLAALKRRLNVEGMSIEDQMRISREANAKRKPYQDGDRQKQRAAQIRAVAKNRAKDTRTDSEKMADAYASPRKGTLGGTRAD